MRSNKLLGTVLWGVGLLLAHLIIFIVPDDYGVTTWITYGFTIFAFLSQLALWLSIWHKKVSAPEQFLYMPTLLISVIYLLLQLVLDLAFVLIDAPAKIAILVNALLVIVMVVMLVLSLVARNTIQKMDQRQEKRRIEL